MLDHLMRAPEAFTPEQLTMLHRVYRRIIDHSLPGGLAGREDIAYQVLCKFRQGARTEDALLRAMQRDLASRSSIRRLYDRAS